MFPGRRRTTSLPLALDAGDGSPFWLAFWRSGWRSGVLAGVLLWRSGGWRSAWRSGVLAFSISGVLAFWRSGWRSGVLVGVLAFWRSALWRSGVLAFCSLAFWRSGVLAFSRDWRSAQRLAFWRTLLLVGDVPVEHIHLRRREPGDHRFQQR